MDIADAGVVQLVEVDVIRAEAREALFARFADIGGSPVVRALALAGLDARVIVEIVAELGAVDELVPLCAKGFAQDGFADAVAVDIGGIVEGDPKIVGLAQEAKTNLVIGDAPHGRTDCPNAEADHGNAQIGIAKRSVLHGAIIPPGGPPRPRNPAGSAKPSPQPLSGGIGEKTC